MFGLSSIDRPVRPCCLYIKVRLLVGLLKDMLTSLLTDDAQIARNVSLEKVIEHALNPTNELSAGKKKQC